MFQHQRSTEGLPLECLVDSTGSAVAMEWSQQQLETCLIPVRMRRHRRPVGWIRGGEWMSTPEGLRAAGLASLPCQGCHQDYRTTPGGTNPFSSCRGLSRFRRLRARGSSACCFQDCISLCRTSLPPSPDGNCKRQHPPASRKSQPISCSFPVGVFQGNECSTSKEPLWCV